MKIALAQLETTPGVISENITRHLEAVHEAVNLGADFIFFPELSLTGYEPTKAKELAFQPEDARLNLFQGLSDRYRISMGLGAPVKLASGIGIGMFYLTPGEAPRIYFKQYLHSDELPFFVTAPGFSGHINTDPKLALAICYEISVDDHVDAAVQSGARVYVASVAKFLDGVEAAYQRLAAIAKSHQLAVLMVNSVGESDGSMTAGQSAIWNEKGELVDQLNDSSRGLLVFDSNTGSGEKSELIIP